MRDVLAAAIADYNELVGRGENPSVPGPALDALIRLHRLAEAEGLTRPPRRSTPVQVIYPYNGGAAGRFGRFQYAFRGDDSTWLARVVFSRVRGETQMERLPLWCLRVLAEAELVGRPATAVAGEAR